MIRITHNIRRERETRRNKKQHRRTSRSVKNKERGIIKSDYISRLARQNSNLRTIDPGVINPKVTPRNLDSLLVFSLSLSLFSALLSFEIALMTQEREREGDGI